MQRYAVFSLGVTYDDEKTDPEGLANALDRLLETALSTPGIMSEYGDPRFGEFLPEDDVAEVNENVGGYRPWLKSPNYWELYRGMDGFDNADREFSAFAEKMLIEINDKTSQNHLRCFASDFMRLIVRWRHLGATDSEPPKKMARYVANLAETFGFNADAVWNLFVFGPD